MAILIQAKMWPIKEKENRQLLILWPNLIPYNRLYKCIVTFLLLNINPSALYDFQGPFFFSVAKLSSLLLALASNH